MNGVIIKAFFLLFCAAVSCPVIAQSTLKMTGVISDKATHRPVEYGTVTITDYISKKVVNGGLTDSTGSFEVGGLTPSVYNVTIECIGYTKRTIDSVWVGKSKSIGTIYLSSADNALKGVTVTASVPIIENKIDKIVYNAANDLTSQGGQALDVLKKVPQVNVDIDGNVELQGNPNIRFLINGKPSSVFGNSVADALAAIPASQIKSIEVITSPGAKYDAQGTGGIINIILKESKVQGMNGSINLSAGSRLENGSVNLNYRHNNFGINAFFSGNAQLISRTPSTQERHSFDSVLNPTGSLTQDGYSDFQRNGYQAGMGFDWSITKRDNIVAAISNNHFGNRNEGITQILQDTIGNGVSSISSQRNSLNRFQTNSFDWSLNYRKTFTREGQELNILYSASYGEPNTYYRQMSTYTGMPDPYTGSTSSNPGTDRQNAISVDYTHPIAKSSTIETGVKTTLQNITSSAEVSKLAPATQEYTPDAGQSYHLQYDLHVYAAYLSASFPITTFLKVKAGARYEYTDTKIDFPNTVIPAYGTLVPSVIFSHDFKNAQFIKLSYTRRIERADYGDVNPFLNFADPYNITTGNPLLKPEIGNNMELGYNKSFGKGSNLYIALIERINTQDHKRVTTFYPSYAVGDTVYTNVSVANVQNLGTEYNSGINLSGSWTIKDKLSFRSNAFFTHRYSAGLPPGINGANGNRFRINMNVTYQLPRNYAAEAFGNYNSASNGVQGRNPQNITYTMAFRKQFWHKNASLGITATNIFNEYTRQVISVQTDTYNSYTVRMLPYRSAGISFTYKFGKLEFKKGKDEDTYLNNPPSMEN